LSKGVVDATVIARNAVIVTATALRIRTTITTPHPRAADHHGPRTDVELRARSVDAVRINRKPKAAPAQYSNRSS